MKIVVYGAGGVGAFYGALLVRAGHDVHFVARGAQLDAIRARGIRIDSKPLGEIVVPRVTASDRAADAGLAQLVLVCVKAHQTERILDDLAAVAGPDTILLPLQNGVESDELLAARFGRARVPAASVYVGATVEEPGVVSHLARGLILIGAPPGFDAGRLAGLRDTLATTGLPVEISDNIQWEQWRKLVWNASFNPVCAVVQRRPHDVLAVPETRALVLGMMREVLAVARALGFVFPEREAEDQLEYTEKLPRIRTSMDVDRERGRAMETEPLVGVVVRKGRELGVPTPLSDALYALLVGIEGPSTLLA
jgi:2-dehydropantoate 2-reductase